METDLISGVGKPGLGPEGKLNVTRVMVKRFVEENQDGITAKVVASRLGLSYITVRAHLDHLVSTRELYVHVIGPRTKIYYPNGRLSHPYSRAIFNLGDQTFTAQLIKNPRGEFAYIQELQNSGIVGRTIAGGIIVRLENLDEFVNKLRAFVTESKASKGEDANAT